MSAVSYTDEEAARALVHVVGGTTWEAVTLAHGYLATLQGNSSIEDAAHAMYERSPQTLRRSRELLGRAATEGILTLLTERTRTGSAENPVTKLFPAAVTEQRFLELLEDLAERRPTTRYTDDRQAGHTLTDFTLHEGDLVLPINIKNAGTRFENAKPLVGLEPDDCVPIPAYKAYAAIESAPNLLYAVSVDYQLLGQLNALLPSLLNGQEAVVWDLLNRYAGSHVKKAEDAFVAATVRKHWPRLKASTANGPFHVISARKSVRVLQTKPKRTPGVGLKAWGTGASGEINVHLSIREDTTPWDEVARRVVASGVEDVIGAVSRKRVEEVHDPEI